MGAINGILMGVYAVVMVLFGNHHIPEDMKYLIILHVYAIFRPDNLSIPTFLFPSYNTVVFLSYHHVLEEMKQVILFSQLKLF